MLRTNYLNTALLLAVLALAGIQWSAQAAVASGADLGSDDDTFITFGVTGQPGGSTPNTNKEVNFRVESDPINPEKRALIHFDLTQFTGLGAGSTVSSAILKLTYSDNSGAALGAPGTHLRVYRLTQLFKGGDPLNAAANVGASWDQAQNGATLWATQGGDFTPTIVSGTGILCTAATAAVVPAANNEIDFDITTIVNGWVNGGLPNDGLIVIGDAESGQNDYYRFFDGADYGGGSALVGPRLNVTFTNVTNTTINASQDTGMSAAFNNVGKDEQIPLTGTNVSANPASMLLKFPLASIPGANNVQSATLRIYSAGSDVLNGWGSGGQAGTGTLTAFKILQPAWTEGTGTRIPGPQTTDGAWWDKYDASTNWITQGGDFDPLRAFVSPSATMAGNNVNVIVDIDVTAIVAEQKIAAAASADFLVKGSVDCDWRLGTNEYAGGVPAPPRGAQLIVSSNASPGPSITVNTPGSLTSGASGTVTWSHTGPMTGFDVYIVTSLGVATKVNGATLGAGVGTFTWTVASPAGAGYTIKVIDPVKLFQGVSGAFSVVGGGGALAISAAPATLPGGTQNTAYTSTTITATGGTAPYTWSAVGLPTGVTINAATGVISGTPTVNGSFNVIVTVTDNVAATASKTYASFNIAAAVGALAITGPATLPGGQVTIAYTSTTVNATGGTPAYTWSASGLPGGLTINAATGVISGTPTASGSFTVTVTVTDAVAGTTNKIYAPITINPAPGALTLTFVTIPSPVVNVPYSFTATATGGTAPYTWSAVNLPAGLTINAATGVISGTPIAVGAVAGVVITVTDSVPTSQGTAPQTVTVIAAAPAAKKGGCDISTAASTESTELLALLALAGLGVLGMSLRRKELRA